MTIDIRTGDSFHDQIRAGLVAQAMGDAMGYAVEFNRGVSPTRVLIRSPFDAMRPGQSVARFSDDTQMAYAVALGLLDADGPDDIPITIARRIVEWYDRPLGGSHRAPGGACSMGARRLKQMMATGQLEREWTRAGKPDAKGCGVVMRALPYAWFDLHPDLAADLSLQTHRSDCARAQGAGMLAAVNTALDQPEDPFDIAQVTLEVCVRYDEETASMVAEAMSMALRRRSLSARRAQEALALDVDLLGRFEGWRGDEALAAALYCFLVHPHDMKACLTLAANTIGDSDSIAAVAGALSGSYLADVPHDWTHTVECLDELLDVADRVYAAVSEPLDESSVAGTLMEN